MASPERGPVALASNAFDGIVVLRDLHIREHALRSVQLNTNDAYRSAILFCLRDRHTLVVKTESKGKGNKRLRIRVTDAL